MREARRLVSKHHSPSLRNQPSSVFRSKQDRALPDHSSPHSVGPGHYNLSFPLVRPKLEAIRKNNNTVIIKVNEKHSPAFQSLEPRFKERRRSDWSSVGEGEGLGRETDKNSIQHRQVEVGMKNRIKKLSDILNNEEEKFRKNLLMGTTPGPTDKLEKVKGSLETINSLKLYKKERERLHFLLKHMKPSNNSRGPEWSKYRETKGNLYSISNVPGPGSYQESHYPTKHRYYDTIEEKSWQFKSTTRRDHPEAKGP